MSSENDKKLLNQRCKLCQSKVADCGCLLGKSPEVHAAFERQQRLT